MKIGAEQQAIAWMVGLRPLIWNYVRGFEDLARGGCGYGTLPLVKFQKAVTKGTLATPRNDRSDDAVALVANVRRIKRSTARRLTPRDHVGNSWLGETLLDEVLTSRGSQTPHLARRFQLRPVGQNPRSIVCAIRIPKRADEETFIAQINERPRNVVDPLLGLLGKGGEGKRVRSWRSEVGGGGKSSSNTNLLQ
jgi:hypothetical protein